jgi:putative peptidoglycan lipid II flippase
MLATVFSRFLGYIWKALLSAFFFGAPSDAFLRANTLPNMFYNILIGALLSALFIPFFTRYIVRGDREELWRLASSLFIVLLVGLSLISLLGVIFAPTLTQWLDPSTDVQTQELTTRLSQIMFPALIFLAWAGLLTALLNSFQNFTLPALAVVSFNAILILFIWLFGRSMGIQAAAWGWAIAGFAQFASQLPGLFPIRFKMYWRSLWHPELKKMAFLALPLLIATAIDQLSPFFEARLTSYLAHGSFTALRNAGVLVQLPLGIFAMSVTTAVYPTLTGQLSSSQHKEAKESILWAIRAISLFILPSAAGLIALSIPITRVLYQYGEFTAFGTSLSAFALSLYAPGLLANATLMVLFRAFYAMQDTLTPVLITFGGLALQIALYFLLIGPLGIGGLALAATVAAFCNMALMILFLRRKIGPLGLRSIFPSLGKMIAAAAVMGGICYLLDRLAVRFLDPNFVVARIAETGILILIGLLIYGLLLYLIRVKEIFPILEKARNLLSFRRRKV